MERLSTGRRIIREINSLLQHELGPKSSGQEMAEAIGFSWDTQREADERVVGETLDELGVAMRGGALPVESAAAPGTSAATEGLEQP